MVHYFEQWWWVVIIDLDDYVKEAEQQLNNKEAFKKLHLH